MEPEFSADYLEAEEISEEYRSRCRALCPMATEVELYPVMVGAMTVEIARLRRIVASS